MFDEPFNKGAENDNLSGISLEESSETCSPSDIHPESALETKMMKINIEDYIIMPLICLLFLVSLILQTKYQFHSSLAQHPNLKVSIY